MVLFHFLCSKELHIYDFTLLYEYLKLKVFGVCVEYLQIHRFFGVSVVHF